MPRTNTDEVYRYVAPGVSELISSTNRVIGDAQIEQEEAEPKLRLALTLLRQWAGDAKTAAELTAMTAGQRLARQAEIEDRFAKLCRAVAYLIRHDGVDD